MALKKKKKKTKKRKLRRRNYVIDSRSPIYFTLKEKKKPFSFDFAPALLLHFCCAPCDGQVIDSELSALPTAYLLLDLLLPEQNEKQAFARVTVNYIWLSLINASFKISILNWTPILSILNTISLLKALSSLGTMMARPVSILFCRPRQQNSLASLSSETVTGGS